MSLNKQLTNTILQTTGSCMIISYSIIFNYYTGLNHDQIITEFLNRNNHLFEKYSLNNLDLADKTPEEQFAHLHDLVFKRSLQQVQFNNRYIEMSLREFSNSHKIQTEYVDNVIDKSIDANLVNNESCLSLSCQLPNNEWHATPIGYFLEFHTIVKGQIVNLGQDMINGANALFHPLQFGDGILFGRLQ